MDKQPRHIPYGRQTISLSDRQAVDEVLASDWLTTGPKVAAFEQALVGRTGCVDAVAVSSGTAALHCAMAALDVGPGDEVIVPPLSFAASANCVAYQGATPVFADVDPDTLLLDPDKTARAITSKTKVVIAVDYAGQPCDYTALADVLQGTEAVLVADACHSLGGKDRGRPVGSLADMSVFSFHPVKHLTTGEGGLVACMNPERAGRIRRLRNHGISTDHTRRAAEGTWEYEMVELGFNYRITDFQCALGLSQLNRLDAFLARRAEIADRYRQAFAATPHLAPLGLRPRADHAWHLFVVRILQGGGHARREMFNFLRQQGIGANVHYLPIHLHPFYRRRFGLGEGLCPVAEAAYDTILSLPLYPAMTDQDVGRVIETTLEAADRVLGAPRRGGGEL